MKQPPLPQGTGPAAEFIQTIADQVFNRLQIIAGPGILIDKTSRGVIIRIDERFLKGGSDAGNRWG